jgi:hypothetical protein
MNVIHELTLGMRRRRNYVVGEPASYCRSKAERFFSGLKATSYVFELALKSRKKNSSANTVCMKDAHCNVRKLFLSC